MAGMISVDEARAAILARLSPLPSETIPLEAAHARVLAEPIRATLSQPPFDASAMDGYAVRLADAREAGATLKVIGLSSAGEGFHKPLAPGAAVRIMTGAPVPDGADHILIQEEAEPAGDEVVVKVAQRRAQHIRRKGVDFRQGDALLPAGARAPAAALALVAAANVARVCVTRRPRIAVIANGDELILPGPSPGRDRIICSIPFGLCPFIEDWGGEARFLGIAPDDKASIAKMAGGRKRLGPLSTADFDLIAAVGGASVGERDFMRAAFSDLGFETVFEKVSVRPGKPTWFAHRGRAAVLGLPGNPASALVMARLFLKPAIERLLGVEAASASEFFFARTDKAMLQNGPREAYLRARVAEGEDGMRCVTPFENQDSSLLTVMAQARALIRREAGAPATPAGGLVQCLLI